MHRNRWEIGDWTDDSDQMILIIESILANDGKVSFFFFFLNIFDSKNILVSIFVSFICI